MIVSQTNYHQYISVTYVEHKAMIYVRFGNVGVEILAFNKSQEKLVNHLDMRPCNFEDRFVFFGIKGFALRIHWRWNGPEQVLGKHLNYSWIHLFRDDLAVVGDIVKQLMQGQALDFFRLHITASVVEVENDVTLVDLLHEKLFSLVWRHFVESW